MRTIYSIMLACAACLALVSCEEKGLLVNSNDVSYLKFAKNMSKDTTTVTFQTYNEGEDAEIPLEVIINGMLRTEDLHFKIEADESKTTLPENLYVLPEDCVIKGGQLMDTIYVVLKNDPRLKTETLKLGIKFIEQEGVKQGDYYYSRAMITVTDRLFKPDWWSVNDLGTDESPMNLAESIYLGEYSEVKYRMFLAELKKDDVIFDGKDTQILRMYSLRLKKTLQDLKDAGQTVYDENGMEVTVEVIG